MLHRYCSLFATALLLLSCASVTFAGGGTFKGQFTYGGDAPEPDAVTVTADRAFCGGKGLVNEDLVVGKTGGLANVLVYLYLSRGETVEIDSAYDALKDQKVRMDNIGCRFEPHVTLLWTEQSIVFGNKDAVGHNVKVEPINPMLTPGSEVEKNDVFVESRRLPSPVACSMHPWMKGWLLVRDNPYFAVTDEEGNFEIKHIPAGDWKFQVWHERAGYVREVKIDGNVKKWSLGRVDVPIEEGGTVDLGKVVVPPGAFDR